MAISSRIEIEKACIDMRDSDNALKDRIFENLDKDRHVKVFLTHEGMRSGFRSILAIAEILLAIIMAILLIFLAWSFSDFELLSSVFCIIAGIFSSIIGLSTITQRSVFRKRKQTEEKLPDSKFEQEMKDIIDQYFAQMQLLESRYIDISYDPLISKKKLLEYAFFQETLDKKIHMSLPIIVRGDDISELKACSLDDSFSIEIRNAVFHASYLTAQCEILYGNCRLRQQPRRWVYKSRYSYDASSRISDHEFGVVHFLLRFKSGVRKKLRCFMPKADYDPMQVFSFDEIDLDTASIATSTPCRPNNAIDDI